MNFRLLLACGIALVALGVSMGVVTAVSDRTDTAPPERLVGPRMPKGLRAFGFTLPDQHGRRFSLASARGRVVAMTFIHSKCTSTCPVTLQTIRGALDDLQDAGVDRRDIEVVALTVDPDADTRGSVRRFLSEQHASDFVRYLVAPRPAMRPIWKRYGIAPQGEGQEDHTAFVLLVDRRGILRIGFPSHQMTSEDLAHDLRLLVDERA